MHNEVNVCGLNFKVTMHCNNVVNRKECFTYVVKLHSQAPSLDFSFYFYFEKDRLGPEFRFLSLGLTGVGRLIE